MRTISATALNYVTTTKGIEPLIVVEIQWIDNGPVYRYCDKAFPSDGVEGRILEMSNLENVINVSKNSSSQSITITLDDSDSVIKNIYNNSDIHKRPVQVFQWFTGLAYADRFLIFEGQVSSPIEWREGDRTISFEVVSKLEDKEIGYSAEEGTFAELPNDLVGRPWPLPFGTVYKVPAIRIDPIPSGISAQADGLADESIDDQIAELTRKSAELSGLATLCFYEALAAYHTGTEGINCTDEFYCDLGDQLTDKGNDYLEQAFQAQQDMMNLITVKARQIQQQRDGIRVIDGATFPQNQTFNTKLGDTYYEGKMAGNTYQVSKRSREDPKAAASGQVVNIQQTQSLDQSTVTKLGFRWMQAGLSFKMFAALPVRYICAMLPCTVVNVYANRNFGENTTKMRVPANYYTVSFQGFGNVVATIVTMSRPLSSYENEGWSDDIHVDMVSPVGPNSVSVLAWLIQNYTNLGIDSASFNAVSSRVANFPANFCLMNRNNIINVLSSIAYHTRCAIWLKNNVFYLRYLVDEPAAVDTISESDVIHGSLKIEHTSTEEIVTKLTGTYTISYDEIGENKVILRHNVSKYGIQEEDVDWYSYTHTNLVELAMTFWLIRKSNTWKLIRFRTPLHKLKLETFDAVTINFASNYSHIGAVTGIIESVSLDSDELEIEFLVWLPVRMGEMTKYNFAFPINDGVRIFPGTVDLPGGAGPGAGTGGSVAPNNGAQFKGVRITFQRDKRKNLDHGHTNPGTDSVDTSVSIVTDLGQIENQLAPTFDYRYNNYNVEPLDRTSVQPKVVPGKILADLGNGAKYNVQIFAKGLDGKPGETKVRSANPAVKLPVGTWVHVVTVVWTTKENDQTQTHYEQVLVPLVARSVYPGKVLSGSGSTYTVELHKNGIAEAGESQAGVKVLQIDSMETIPANTWLLVAEGQTQDGTPEYSMQPPIWLE